MDAPVCTAGSIDAAAAASTTGPAACPILGLLPVEVEAICDSTRTRRTSTVSHRESPTRVLGRCRVSVAFLGARVVVT
jgi:hypothetical protein